MEAAGEAAEGPREMGHLQSGAGRPLFRCGEKVNYTPQAVGPGGREARGRRWVEHSSGGAETEVWRTERVAVRVQPAQGALQVGQDRNERVGREGDITDLS